MRIKSIGVSNYRNIKFARLDLDAPRVFLLGKNGQGKTNLLEAVGYLTSLRSFRTRENETLIAHGCATSEMVYELNQEQDGEAQARILLKKKGKEVSLDGETVKRASEFVGRFPTVMLSSEDLSLVRGSPSVRRRFLDTFLCGIDRSYYVALQRYQKSLAERNALLKQNADPTVLSSFESQLAEPALEIVTKRREVSGELGKVASCYYETLSGAVEGMAIDYRPNLDLHDRVDFQEALERNRKRDSILQSTSRGPHRDDFDLSLDSRPAASFASDGQQRCIALALAFACLNFWQQRFGVAPILLVDDVLGELDPERRQRFWSALDSSIQLIATGTSLPEAESDVPWLVYEVADGEFRKM